MMKNVINLVFIIILFKICVKGVNAEEAIYSIKIIQHIELDGGAILYINSKNSMIYQRVVNSKNGLIEKRYMMKDTLNINFDQITKIISEFKFSNVNKSTKYYSGTSSYTIVIKYNNGKTRTIERSVDKHLAGLMVKINPYFLDKSDSNLPQLLKYKSNEFINFSDDNNRNNKPDSKRVKAINKTRKSKGVSNCLLSKVLIFASISCKCLFMSRLS